MDKNVEKRNLATTFLRLRSDAAIEPLPVDDAFWRRIAGGELGTFHNEYLVSMHEFNADWTGWEMHPNGDEIVCLLSGQVTFVLDLAQGRREVLLDTSGAFVLVPRGTWHTARTDEPSRMLFITAGEGTEHCQSR